MKENNKKRYIKMVKDYLLKEGKPVEEYRIQIGHADNIVNAYHQDDLKAAIPGGGSTKSLQFIIDTDRQCIEKILHFQ